MFEDAFIKSLIDRTDIVDVIGKRVQLKKSGKDFSALCPFHSEKSPSFTVSPTKQFYHCFGCGAHGNAITFLRDYSGYGFVDAVKSLAGDAGMAIPEPRPISAEDLAREQRRFDVMQVLAIAASDFESQLSADAVAREYVNGRGLTDETVKKFGIGYAGGGLRSALSGVSTDLLDRAGLVSVDEETGEVRERFARRIMFPIRNADGVVIGFGGRVLGRGKPKYVNSPETEVFHKGDELFGLDLARATIRRDRVGVVVEGYVDVAMLHQHADARVVAALGTSLTQGHVTRLFQVCDRAVFCFDGDAAGLRAADRAAGIVLGQIKDGKRADFVALPPEHDPDTYVRAFGIDAWRKLLVDSAVPLSEKIVQLIMRSGNVAVAEDRAAMARDAIETVRAIGAAPAFRAALHGRLQEALGMHLRVPGTVTPARQAKGPADRGESFIVDPTHHRVALLLAIDRQWAKRIPEELVDDVVRTLMNWFADPSNLADRDAPNFASVQSPYIRAVLAGALKSESDRTAMLGMETTKDAAEVMLEALRATVESKARMAAIGNLFGVTA
ncbi:DNA primase [Pandoraea sp. ISTKB]|uniref:DNA primase n=1 Tax=Pandoraea sp. ISTKB TaxID=1586708 RepID=UPI000846874F|nr:DNA primase [Pandoraea sp. ISTKB]ODP35101.1 DNA primase [Pandoraea sp. ISTKB]